MSGEPKLKALDALHAELLVDVQEIAQGIKQFRAEVPVLIADISESAAGVKTAARNATSDFESMGHALVAVTKRQVAEERESAAKANRAAAANTRAALNDFTKYFWLLCGLTAVNSLFTFALVLREFLRGG